MKFNDDPSFWTRKFPVGHPFEQHQGREFGKKTFFDNRKKWLVIKLSLLGVLLRCIFPECGLGFSSWWFQIYLIFNPDPWGNDPI